MTKSVMVGTAAPDFSLQNEMGEDWRLSDLRGNVVALLFYPQDETMVCTRQLCSVRDRWSDYLATKAVVVGISRGTVAEHRRFARDQHLPFHLLADTNRVVTRTYCQRPWVPLIFTRSIVVIDGKGIIRHHRVMSRARRPTDYQVLSQIYASQTEVRMEQYQEILAAHRDRLKRFK